MEIVTTQNGQIEKIGTYAELSKKELLNLGLTTQDDQPENDETSPKKRTNRLQSVSLSETSTNEEEGDEPQETQELIEKGSIPTSLYWTYIHSGAPTIVLVLLLLLIVLAQVVCNSSDLWLKHWTTTEEQHCNATSFNDTITTTCGDSYVSKSYYIWIYTVLIVLTIILTTVRSMGFYKVCMNASKTLHNTMFSNILQATMRFFDTNPSGRILNRFSKDIGAIDEILPRCMLDAIQIFMVMLGILAMVFIVSPVMVAPAIVLGVLFGLVRYVYMASAQDLKRLEGVTKAPVFSHVSESMAGLTTIRSSCAEGLVLGQFDTFQDKHTSSFSLMISTAETFGWYLDLISVAFLAVVTFQFFWANEVFGGDVGLVISQSLILTGMLQHGMRQTTEVANNMTSVERVLQYTKLDKEGPFESTPTHKPHRDWPQKGMLQFRNVFLQYTPEEPAVLKQLNFVIKAGEKVGIVGRTGAGKSSLIAAIFRLAPIEGAIYIDELNTKEMGLHDLRSSISIIPQEPVLFSTTIRNNLDPFDRCDDETLWRALENVELKDAVDKLEQEVSEGGSNFSAGQRQLICLARAIIRNNKIIIMDEATANVDQQTDALIQKTIRKNFSECTVLTIAHRLNTVMDSDKVLVMDAGEVVEFDHPHKLLQKVGGELAGLVSETGDAMFATLAEVARVSYEETMREQDDEVLGVTMEVQKSEMEMNNIEDNKTHVGEDGEKKPENNKDITEYIDDEFEIIAGASDETKPSGYVTNKNEEISDTHKNLESEDNKGGSEGSLDMNEEKSSHDEKHRIKPSSDNITDNNEENEQITGTNKGMLKK